MEEKRTNSVRIKSHQRRKGGIEGKEQVHGECSKLCEVVETIDAFVLGI